MLTEQTFILNNIDSFELKDIFECGQCFRRNVESDWSYTWIFKGNVINVQKVGNQILFHWLVDWNIESVVRQYFDLNRKYSEIKDRLSKIDEYMQESIEYWWWIRLLNQDLWETIISFIISANNNIPRIKWIIERLSEKYWTEIVWNDKKYYTFPTVEQLRDVGVSDFRKLWLGFRDERVFSTTRMILDGKFNLQKSYFQDTLAVRERLFKLSGVWPKVADCILLFSDLKRLEVFPIDVRVRRVMNNLYIHNPNEEKVNKNQILKLAQDKFWNLAWIAQEYLFYRARTQKY